MIVIDADFLSSFLKIGRLNLVKDFFNIEFLYTPIGVLQEIAKTDLVNEFLKINYVKIIKVSDEDFSMLVSEEFESLGSGEKECIALCKQSQNSLLLINDNKARKIAEENGIAVLNISGFLLACKKTMFLDKNEIALIMQDLKQKDYYEFGEDEKKRLLNS